MLPATVVGGGSGDDDVGGNRLGEYEGDPHQHEYLK